MKMELDPLNLGPDDDQEGFQLSARRVCPLGFPLTGDNVRQDLRSANNVIPKADETTNQWKVVLPNPLWKLDKAMAKPLARRGIPHPLRSQIWPILSGGLALQGLSPDYYPLKVLETKMDQTKSTEQIELDISRTFPTHSIVNTPEFLASLRRVLRVCSDRRPEVGYAQSMNYIAALLLLVLDEEDAFWTLCAIFEDILPADTYSTQLLGAHVDQKVLRGIIKWKFPLLITSAWFLTLYANVLPVPVAIRVWDAFFCEGIKVLFRVAVSIIAHIEGELMKATDMGTAFQLISKAPSRFTDPTDLLDGAFSKKRIGSFPMKKIQVLREHYRPLVVAEMDALDRNRKLLAAEREKFRAEEEKRLRELEEMPESDDEALDI